MTKKETSGTNRARAVDTTMLTIAEVSRALTVPVPTIRSWERRYGYLLPRRTAGGHRRYNAEDAERIRILRDEIARGRRPREIALRMGTVEPPSEDRGSERLVRAALDLDETAIRDVLATAVAEVGVEVALEQVALAGLRRIGDHWQFGGCGTQHEHLATHEIRRWIARMTALAPSPFRSGAILMASAPDDGHSVGLEGFGLIMARRGWECVVLGPRTPVDALAGAVQQRRPVATVLSTQWTRARRSAVDALREVSRIRDGALFYAGAAFAAPVHRKGIPGRYLPDRLLEAAIELEGGL